ncbi:hypothetical protein F4777DRAFT_569822 [Nemania sp. FL0916]|nr:hypothetical protein F4777DRAFT_569822 [Nemania sp. FL0916]
MKCTAVIVGFFAAAALSAPVKVRGVESAEVIASDAFNYHNNINNAVTVNDAVNDADSDEFNYHNNINNAATVKSVKDADFNYGNYIDNLATAKDADDTADSDLFNYTNNIDNAATVTDADGTKVVLSSPYTDDVDAANAAEVLGE